MPHGSRRQDHSRCAGVWGDWKGCRTAAALECRLRIAAKQNTMLDEVPTEIKRRRVPFTAPQETIAASSQTNS
jgi:hypothetical protein